MGQPQAIEQDVVEATTDELAPGHSLMQGQYTIDSFVQAGGFGITYTARNSLGRKVIIKECFPGAFCRRSDKSVRPRSSSHVKEFSSILSKFVNEARSLAKVKHPNIVGVHEVFEENETAYMALDYVEGCDLLDVIEGKENRPDPEQIQAILGKVLGAVGAIHEQGMLHRDISPDNIMLQSNMEPILIDFGAAREDIGQESRKLSEMRVIKDGYSPQEFYISGSDQGPFSDLYALAATFYHLITGELPVDSQTRLAAVAAGDPDPYMPVVGRVSEYPERFLRGIDTAMAILPKDRIASAHHWLDLLHGTGRAGNAAASANSARPTAPASKPSQDNSNTTKARLLGGIALVIPIVGAVYVLQNNERSPAIDETTTALTIAEPTQTATIATATPDVATVTSSDATPAPDLSAILNLPAATTQPEITSPESPEEILAGLIETASPKDANAATDLALADIVPTVEIELASTLDAGLVEGTEPAPAVQAADDVIEPTSINLSQDLAALEVSLASEPQSDTPDAPPEFLIESFDLPQVTSAWSVDLSSALPVASDTIYAINGMSLEANSEIDTALYQMMQAPEAGTVELSILAGASQSDAAVETIMVPVVHKTSLLNGAAFETRMIDGIWTTVVTDAPAGSDFEIGDVVVGDLGSETLFDQRTSLPDMLIQANAQDLDRLTLAVRRDADMSVASLLVPR